MMTPCECEKEEWVKEGKTLYTGWMLNQLTGKYVGGTRTIREILQLYLPTYHRPTIYVSVPILRTCARLEILQLGSIKTHTKLYKNLLQQVVDLGHLAARFHAWKEKFQIYFAQLKFIPTTEILNCSTYELVYPVVNYQWVTFEPVSCSLLCDIVEAPQLTSHKFLKSC